MFTLCHCSGFVSALLVFSPFYVTLYSYIGIARVAPPTAVCFLSAFPCLPDWLAPPHFLAAPGGLNGNQTGREGSPSAHDLIFFFGAWKWDSSFLVVRQNKSDRFRFAGDNAFLFDALLDSDTGQTRIILTRTYGAFEGDFDFGIFYKNVKIATLSERAFEEKIGFGRIAFLHLFQLLRRYVSGY